MKEQTENWQATVTVGALKAVLLAAGKEVRRDFTLTNVLLEIADGAAILVASDGHRMHVAAEGTASVLLSSFELEAVVKGGNSKSHLETKVVIAPDNGGKLTTVTKAGGPLFHIAPDTGNFPDWRRQMIRGLPDGDEEAVVAQFNPMYLADVQKAVGFMCGATGASLRGVPLQVCHSGDDPALVTAPSAPGFAAIVMPLRLRDSGIDKNTVVAALRAPG